MTTTSTPLGRYVKTSVERKRYSLDYSAWLDNGEQISRVEFAVTASANAPSPGSPIFVDAYSINSGKNGIIYFVSFGDDGVTYTLDIRITTSGGQVKEDTVIFAVRNPT